MKILRWLDGRHTAYLVALAAVLMALMGGLDYLLGNELSFSFFYLLPIVLLAWFAGSAYGVPAAILAAIVWFGVDVASGQQYSQPVFGAWNAGIRFGFFLTAALLLSALRTAQDHSRELSRKDYLTGAASAGHFYEQLQEEIDRCKRYAHPFTLAYLDIDDFKKINDRFGHDVGDEALRTLTSHAAQRLRRTDTFARLGGDEFAIILPETDQETAPVVLAGLQQALRDDHENGDKSMTCSIGVMTFNEAPGTADEAVRLADMLMYEVKNSGKNGVNFSAHTVAGAQP